MKMDRKVYPKEGEEKGEEKGRREEERSGEIRGKWGRRRSGRWLEWRRGEKL